MTPRIFSIGASVALPVLALAALASCGEPSRDPGTSTRADAKVVEAKFPERVYWGDTHLHTNNSVDAFGFGVRLDPEDALRFAKGEAVTSTQGMKAQLDRPLDFLVIADHSDALGALRRIYEAPRFLLPDPVLRRWHDTMHASPDGALAVTAELIDRVARNDLPPAFRDPKINLEGTRTIWKSSGKIVERYNRPGKFTAFHGFEWTSMPRGNNLHRVVMFRDGYAEAMQVLPASSQPPLDKVETLYDYMDRYEKLTGGKALAIPHNSNVSNGLMFELTGPDGGPMTAAHARRRAAREPLVEVTQIKGDSEAHPFLSPNDEFADFGDKGWDLGNLTMEVRKTDAMLAGDYAREALKRGLAIEARTGVNPYKFGMIGATDSHTGLATADENNFFGKHSASEPNATRAGSAQNLGNTQGRFGWHYLAGGYAGVWATANTRSAIFDAMIRREVYATTGPRMTVRFFGGWDFAESDMTNNWVAAGYARGVPMGGELKPAALKPAVGGAPRFIVSALKDPMGANLDRVQMVKGWVDASGQLQERIFDVVWSSPDTRQPGADGKLPAVGNTVNIAKATYRNSIGAPELQTIWTDPQFDPAQRAFYYVRVLEIPTPRWVVFDALRYGAKLPADAELVAQERAYSSPIWYRPAPVTPERVTGR